MSEREEAAESMDVRTAAPDRVATTVEITTTPAPAPVETATGGGDLGKVRELVLKAHPDVVPDLVRGGSVDELIASVEPARSAYQRIADQVRERSSPGSNTETTVTTETTVVEQPPVVPAGGATNVVDPGDLAPTTKIAQALAARRQK